MSITAAKMAASRMTMMRTAILTHLRPSASAAANHFLNAAPNAPLMEVFENRVAEKDPTQFLRLAFASKQRPSGSKFDYDEDEEDYVSDSTSDYDDEDEFEDEEEEEEMEGFHDKYK